ncbi:MAG: hypothetical protein MZU97_17790 [Bacillus subtilis]|nr:hypothetical protein [Bacillus subtilis]
MKLYEYQAKQVFVENGIPTPTSKLITDISELEEAIEYVKLPLRPQITSFERRTWQKRFDFLCPDPRRCEARSATFVSSRNQNPIALG